MNKYNSSQIYITQYKDLIYIGSTTKSLKTRMETHKHDYNRFLKTNKKYNSIYKIFEKTATPYSETLEFCNFNTRKELEDRETYFIQLYSIIHNNSLVNSSKHNVKKQTKHNFKNILKKNNTKKQEKHKFKIFYETNYLNIDRVLRKKLKIIEKNEKKDEKKDEKNKKKDEIHIIEKVLQKKLKKIKKKEREREYYLQKKLLKLPNTIYL